MESIFRNRSDRIIGPDIEIIIICSSPFIIGLGIAGLILIRHQGNQLMIYRCCKVAAVRILRLDKKEFAVSGFHFSSIITIVLRNGSKIRPVDGRDSVQLITIRIFLGYLFSPVKKCIVLAYRNVTGTGCIYRILSVGIHGIRNLQSISVLLILGKLIDTCPQNNRNPVGGSGIRSHIGKLIQTVTGCIDLRTG